MMSGSGSQGPETSSRVSTLTKLPTVSPRVEGSQLGGGVILSLTLLSDPGPSLWHRTSGPWAALYSQPCGCWAFGDPAGSM